MNINVTKENDTSNKWGVWIISQTNCCVWKEDFDDNKDKNYYKIRDHCHYTGKCRSAEHGICNLRCIKKII